MNDSLKLESTIAEPKLEDFALWTENMRRNSSAGNNRKPILYLLRRYVGIALSTRDLVTQPALKAFDPGSIDIHRRHTGETESEIAESGTAFFMGVDVWVTSTRLTIFAPQLPYGVHIPRRCIVAHRVDDEGVELILRLDDENNVEGPTPLECKIKVHHSKDESKDYAPAVGDEGEQSNLSLSDAIVLCRA